MTGYKKESISLLLFLILFSTGFSQKILIPYRNKNLWGYADTSGVIKIKPIYDSADFFNFSKTVTEVYKDRKVSLITIDGNLLFPLSDSYQIFGNNYFVTKDKKQGVYSKTGKLLVPIEYDLIECTCYYHEYEKEKNKVVGLKNNKYYLIDLTTQLVQQISSPKNEQANESTIREGIVLAPDNIGTTSAPWPQYSANDFPKLSGLKNLVHCKTIYLDGKPVFYIFCKWNNRQMTGYVGQNGVEFFKD